MLKQVASSVLLSGVLLMLPSRAWADDPPRDRSWRPLVQLARETALDPTTYAPAALGYASSRLDWKTSQPFFRNGYVEDNARYTISGYGHDVPVGYAEGNRRIVRDMLSLVPTALATNALTHATARALTHRFPNHTRLIRTLSWIERTSVASFLSYRVSEQHLRQWRKNVNDAQRLGF